MLQRPSTTPNPKLIVGVAYFSPYASPEALKKIRRFVRGQVRGRYRWGNLYRYPMIEFEDVDDLSCPTEVCAAHRRTLSRPELTSSYEGFGDCDFVLEAATEDEDIKRQIFAALGSVLKPEAIIGSTTSSIAITHLAANTDRPDGSRNPLHASRRGDGIGGTDPRDRNRRSDIRSGTRLCCQAWENRYRDC